MDEKEKAKYIELLANDTTKFVEPFTLKNYAQSRRWFVRKIIEHFQAQVEAGLLSEAEIKVKTEGLVRQSYSIVASKKDFKISVAIPESSESQGEKKALARARLARRVEILYGAIVTNPEFADPSYSDFLDFIVKRRYRSVTRMDFYVNLSTKRERYFSYPRKCTEEEKNERWQVNEDAQKYWVRIEQKNPFPLKLTLEGTTEPVIAIQQLFRKKAPCKGNLLDCATVMSIVLMDSLLEAGSQAGNNAEKQKQLLKQLSERKGNLYLTIDHPVSGRTNFMTDSTNTTLLRQYTAPVSDLEVGDYIYLYNHPIYKVFSPTGSWTGEHSLVYQFGNKTVDASNGVKLGGHGMEGTIFEFYDRFMNQLKTFLNCVRAITKLHLQYMSSKIKSNFDVAPTDTNVLIGWNDESLPPLTVDSTIYRYVMNKPLPFVSLLEWITPEKWPIIEFFVVQSKALNEFFIPNTFLFDEKKKSHRQAKRLDIVNLLGRGLLTDPIHISQGLFPPSGISTYDPVEWSIRYYDTRFKEIRLCSLFTNKSDQMVPSEIRMVPSEIRKEDLFAWPFSQPPLFSLPSSFVNGLSDGKFDEDLRREFEKREIRLGSTVKVEKDINSDYWWHISDGEQSYVAGLSEDQAFVPPEGLVFYYSQGARVLKPEVDFSINYQSFLRSLGIIKEINR